MSKPQRSLRLEKRSARSLEVLSGAPGEIFFDNDNETLRVYTDNAGDSIILANRQWVNNNTFDGNYNSLSNKPALSSVAASGDYNDLLNVPLEGNVSTLTNIGDVYVNNLQQDDALVWDGSLWTNRSPSQGTATTEYVDTAINNLINTAPATLDTLNELAASLGDDPDFAGTVITALSNKANAADLATVATSGAFSDLTGTPTTIAGYGITDAVDLTDISVDTVIVTQTFGSLSYDNTTGVFTFIPPDGAAILTNSSGFGVQAATVATSGAYSDLTGTPVLEAVATSGSYNDLIDQPDAASFGLGNVTNESKATMFTNPSFTQFVTMPTQTEIFYTPLVGATVGHDLSTSSVYYYTPNQNFTANFNAAPTTNNRTISVALILVQGATAYMPTAVQIDNVNQTLFWQGGSAPTGTANGIDVVSFTLIRYANAWEVIGSATGYA